MLDAFCVDFARLGSLSDYQRSCSLLLSSCSSTSSATFRVARYFGVKVRVCSRSASGPEICRLDGQEGHALEAVVDTARRFTSKFFGDLDAAEPVRTAEGRQAMNPDQALPSRYSPNPVFQRMGGLGSRPLCRFHPRVVSSLLYLLYHFAGETNTLDLCRVRSTPHSAASTRGLSAIPCGRQNYSVGGGRQDCGCFGDLTDIF